MGLAKDGVGNLKLLAKRENTELAQLGGPRDCVLCSDQKKKKKRDCVLCEFHVWGISGELNQVLLTAMGIKLLRAFWTPTIPLLLVY